MKRSLLPYLSALPLVFVLNCSRATTTAEKKPVALLPPDQRTIVDHTKPTKRATDVDLSEGRKIVTAVYRVRPDRRFSNAVADIIELTAGSPTKEIEIDFDRDYWMVRVAGVDAVTLPELATFHQALEELTRFASGRRGVLVAPASSDVVAAIDDDLAHFYPRFLFSALRKLDVQGERLDAASSARAAKAATLLVAQSYDEFGIAEVLESRALALLARARSLDSKCCPEDEVALAHKLGYTVEARAMAEKLPAHSFARALTGLAGEVNGEAGEWLRTRAELRDEKQPPEIDVEGAPVLLESAGGTDRTRISVSVQESIIASLDATAKKRTDDAAGRLAEFERLLSTAAQQHATRSLDARSIRSYYEANFYAASYQQFYDLHHRLGLPDKVDELTRSLQPRTAVGAQVVSWMSQVSAARYGRSQNFRPAPAIASIALLDGTRNLELLHALSDAIGGSHPGIRSAARELFMRLDSRPSELWTAGRIAEHPIGHIKKSQEYLREALRRSTRLGDGETAQVLFNAGEMGSLRRLARDRTASAEDRLVALGYLADIQDERLHADFERAIADTGYDPSYLNIYVGYLNERNEPQIKERFVRLVLQKNDDLHPITKANAVSSLADALERQGRFREAWEVTEPHIEVGSENILSTAVSLHQRLGRDAEAIRLGHRMIDRYPSADARADFAEVLWRMRRHGQAAELFNPATSSNALETFTEHVPPRFVRAFKHAQLDEAMKAYDALIAANVPVESLEEFPGEAFEAKSWALAVALEERFLAIPATAMDRNRQIASLRTGYKAVRELKGPDVASRWFIDRAPATEQLSLVVALFMEHETELARQIVILRPPTDKQPALAAIVGACLIVDRVPQSDPRWNLVRSLIAETPATERGVEYVAAKYLIREDDESAVAAAATTSADRTTAAFFIALGEAAAGRYDDALTDLLVAGEGPGNYVTNSFAISQLYVWRAKLRPWEAIVRERLL